VKVAVATLKSLNSHRSVEGILQQFGVAKCDCAESKAKRRKERQREIRTMILKSAKMIGQLGLEKHEVHHF